MIAKETVHPLKQSGANMSVRFLHLLFGIQGARLPHVSLSSKWIAFSRSDDGNFIHVQHQLAAFRLAEDAWTRITPSQRPPDADRDRANGEDYPEPDGDNHRARRSRRLRSFARQRSSSEGSRFAAGVYLIHADGLA